MTAVKNMSPVKNHDSCQKCVPVKNDDSCQKLWQLKFHLSQLQSQPQGWCPLVVSQRDQLTSDSDSANLLSVKIGTPHDFWFNSKFHLSQLQGQSQGWSLSCQFERSTDLRFKISDPTWFLVQLEISPKSAPMPIPRMVPQLSVWEINWPQIRTQRPYYS